jgi:pentatricopeptide repeat protein
VTGVGVRESSREDAAPFVTEKEFNEVLNAFANCGRMDMAHRVVALQERTAHAPALSPVTYSILLKGYGRLGDLPNVEVVLSQAAKYQIEPDTILLNTLIDAYINCNAMEKAREVFLEMKKPSDTHTGILGGISWPRPNRRTYNTMLKGFASSGDLAAALSLSEEMKSLRIWDAVTTNTLAHAAIVAGDLSLAEDVLTNHSVAVDSGLSKSGEHPNVEAYTELLDAYAKTQQLENALLVLQRMKQREVDPNEVTYTCLMGGFGRGLKVDEARKTLAFMDSTGLKPTSKVYHALVSGLVSKNASTMGDLDSRVDEAIAVLREMIQSGVRPNAVTVAILIEALGRCHHPRVSEASLLVEKLTMQRIIPDGNAKVLTGLVQSYGKAGDIEGALKAFGMMMKPDTVAVNAFLDACCRCNRLGLAIKTFDNCFRSKKAVSPDVISYSVLIGALFKVNTAESIRQARAMYLEMKTRNKIDPDTALVDVILKAMIRFSHSNRLEKQDLRFVASVIRDAEKLRWEDGQLERRKRGIQNALSDRMGGVRGKESLNALLRTSESTDDLLERKGWNKIDSGFRLWGGERDDLVGLDSSSVKPVDEFLESHGWNDVDSGFRLF